MRCTPLINELKQFMKHCDTVPGEFHYGNKGISPLVCCMKEN